MVCSPPTWSCFSVKCLPKTCAKTFARLTKVREGPDEKKHWRESQADPLHPAHCWRYSSQGRGFPVPQPGGRTLSRTTAVGPIGLGQSSPLPLPLSSSARWSKRARPGLVKHPARPSLPAFQNPNPKDQEKAAALVLLHAQPDFQPPDVTASYRVRLEGAPPQPLSFTLQMRGPEKLGNLSKVTWSLDRTQVS